MYDFSDAPHYTEPAFHDDTDELRAFLRDTLEMWLPRLLNEGVPTRGVFLAGSTAGEKGKSLNVQLHGSRRGLWVDHATGEGGDAFALIQACMGCSFQDAIRIAREMRGMQLPTSKVKIRQQEEKPSSDAMQVQRVLHGCGDIAGSSAERYLRSRGLDTPATKELRAHPALMHWPARTAMPGIVGVVRALSNEIIGVHRTYLTPAGEKAPVDPVRMMLGEVKGGAVRLRDNECHAIGLCEGIETGLSVMQLLGLDLEVPIWACLSTSGLRAIEVPHYVKRVVIFADFDEPLKDGYHAGKRPGTLAAEVLADRLTQEGRSVEVRYPAPGFADFNDQLMGVKT